MTWNLNEPFDAKDGNWQTFAPTDGTEAFDDFMAFLFTAAHADLRNFRVISGTVPVPQTDLDALDQDTLDGEPQTALEVKPGAIIASENWVQNSGSGTSSFTVGKLADYGGWSGLRAITNGSALVAEYESVISEAVDITVIASSPALRLTFPDYDQTNLDGTSWIQLTSGGDFGGGGDSPQVLFSDGVNNPHYITWDISLFELDGFNPADVTGVKIHLAKAAGITTGSKLTMMALRVENLGTWEGGSYVDFDTLLGAAVVPVTFDGSFPPPVTSNQGFQFVRGDESGDDPIPSDLAMNVYFSPGGGTSPNDTVTFSADNQIGVIMREIKDTADGTGTHIEANLFWSGTETVFQVQRVDTTGGSPGTPTIVGEWNTDDHGPSPAVLDPTKNYLFHVELVGTSFNAALYETDLHHNAGALVWQLPITLSDEAYVYRNGRVGWISALVSRDAYVDSISVSPQGFATLETEVFHSRTPVDGAQLAAVFSQDKNLWDSYTGSDILIDQTKTLSGVGSWRTAAGLQSNTFVVDDWTQMYFDFQIFVGNTVTRGNQPSVILNTPDGFETLNIPVLQPSQWNFVHCDLTIFQNLINGIGYSLSILPNPSPDKPLGNFWVDETVIGRRRVEWAMRATPNGPYRQFKDMINNPKGAVHLPHYERGMFLQLKAVALTEDAWVSSFKCFPHYAPLGNLLTDKVWGTNVGRELD